MKIITLFASFLLAFFLFGCGTNTYLHKDLTKENIQKIVLQKEMKENDTLWLNSSTISIKTSSRCVEMGSVKHGIKKGKWYSYYLTDNDSIDCFYIRKFRKRDTLQLYVIHKNYTWF